MRKNYSSSKPASTKGFNMFAVVAAAAVLFFSTAVFNKVQAAVATALSTTSPAVPAANICQGALKVPVYAFDLTVSGGTTTLTGCNFTTATGTYVAGDVTRFQLWYGASTLAAATQVGSDIVATLGNGLHTFTIGVAPSLASGLWHCWITTDVAANAVGGHTIITSAMTSTNFTVGTGTKSGNGFIGGTQTVILKPFITTNPTSPMAGCVGSSIFLTGMVSGGAGATYQWQYAAGGNVTNGNPVGSVYTSANTAVLQIDGLAAGTYTNYYKCVVSGTCSPAATSGNVTVTVSNTSPVSVSIQATAPNTGFGPFVLCAATSYTFLATATWGGTSPTFDWLVNNVSVQNSTSATFTTVLNPTDYVDCIMTIGTGVTCPSANTAPSNTIMTSAAAPVTTTPSQSTPLSTRCKGGGTTSTGNFNILGSPARFEWQIQNAGTSTIVSPTTVNNTTITWDPNFVGVAQVRMRGNNVCFNGAGPWGPWRNDTVLAIYTPVSVIKPDFSRYGLNGGLYWDTICHRTNVTFSNYVNSVVQPYPYGAATYEWYWNGAMVQTSTSNQYLNNNLLDLDTVRLRVVPSWTTTTTMYSDGNRCPNSAPFSSNTYHMNVYPDDPPSIISVTANPNPGCQGQAITLTAAVGTLGLGNSPQYQWYDIASGAIPGATGLTYSGVFSPGMHDIFFMVTSSDTCASPNQVIYPSPTFYSLQVDLCYDTMNTSGNVTINRCGGTLYDSGGPSGNYSNNESGTLTICPATAGQYVSLSFTSFTTEAGVDFLTIYNGTTIAAPVLAPSPLSGTLSCSSPFTSSHASGCLTLKFVSNGSNINTGWAANMSCVSVPPASTPGNGCSNPVMISTLPYSVTGQTNQCFGNNQTSGCATGNYTGTDKFYRYDASGPECITVNINGATSNSISLAVWKDCPGAPGSMCVAQWTGAVGGALGGQTTLPSVGTYYFVADATVGVNYNYNLVINSFGAAPLNDLPCNAEPLIQTINHYDDNSCAGSETGGGVNNSNCVSGNLNTLWYTFTTNSGQIAARIRFTRGLGSLLDPVIQVYSGTCSSLTYLNCNDDGNYCNTIYDQPYLQFTTTGSTQYWIRVDGFANTVGSYQLVVDDPNNVTPAYGYDCGNPIQINAQSCTYGSPAFIGIGNQCDFPYSNSAGFFGERDGVYFLFQTIAGQNGANNLTFDIYSDPSVTTDWDFIIWNVTSYYPNNICDYLNYAYGPWSTSSGQISSSWVDTWQSPANGHTGCRSTGTTHINGFPFNAPIPLSGTQWWMLYISNFRFGQFPYGFTLDMGYSPVSTTSNYNPVGQGAVVYNTSAPPQMIWWTGQGGTTNWFTQANWGGCATPSCNNNTSATIASYYSPSNPYFPVINGSGAISKDLTIRPGGSLTVNSTYNLDMCGNWLNLGTFNALSSSSVTCTGGSTQYFDGLMSGNNSFENLNMSKSPGVNMYLYNKAQVTGTLGLTNGRIITGAKELYVSNLSPTSVPIGGIASFVQGNLRRNLDPTGGVYYWPVGISSSFQRAKLTFGAGLTIPNILGFFSPWGSLPGATGLADAGCSTTYNTSPGFLDNGYWTLTASANPTGAQYDMVLYNTAVTNGGGATSWTVAKAPTIAGPWILDGNCDMTSTQATTKRNGMVGFSVFATAQNNNVLPITLLNFDAVAKGTGVQTTWVTATETNNDYFVVERSVDGINFEQVGTRKGAGNSAATLYYSMLDGTPLKGVSYYRLRQVDFDGQESKSQIVAVSFLETNVLNVYPNPATDATSYMTYEFNSSGDGLVRLEIVDMLGRVVITQNVNATKGANKFEKENGLNVSFLPHGVYIMQLKPVNSEIIEPMQKRFVKQTREE